MGWNLEIHHIDVGQGDATLIVAKETPPLTGANPIVRSALIDGGKFNKRLDVHKYITTVAGLAQLHVMIATHYDDDHFGGLRGLLCMDTTAYDNTLIFDQGEPGAIRIIRRKRKDQEPVLDSSIENRDDEYLRYLQKVGRRDRITKKVVGSLESFEGTIGQDGWQYPYWLVGKEILWTDKNGNPCPTLLGGAEPAPALAVPPPEGAIQWPGGSGAPGTLNGPPAIICIAANQYILQNGGGIGQQPLQSGQAVDPKNEKSLAFVVIFNNFRYYIGGDIESTQEDGSQNNGIRHYLNPDNTDAGRVLAMKTSHHGSDRSTSAQFVNRLKPSAAFISCGCNNNFGHPHKQVLNNLQGCAQLSNYYLTQDRDDTAFNERVGAQGVTDIAAAYSQRAVVAGSWGPKWDAGQTTEMGNIVLTVSEQQSENSVDGPLAQGQSRFTVTCFVADTQNASTYNTDHV